MLTLLHMLCRNRINKIMINEVDHRITWLIIVSDRRTFYFSAHNLLLSNAPQNLQASRLLSPFYSLPNLFFILFFCNFIFWPKYWCLALRYDCEANKLERNNAAKSSETIAQSVVQPTVKCDKNKIIDSEFVSDTFHTSEKDLEEVKAGMKMLGIDTLATQTSSNGKQRTKLLNKTLTNSI